MFENDYVAPPRWAPAHRVAASVSVLAHLTMGVIVVWISTLPDTVFSPEGPRAQPREHLVWLATSGLGGGGGGGGDRTPVAARAKAVGRDRLTVPTRRPAPSADMTSETPPIQSVTIPAVPRADASESATGLIAPAPPAITHGPGTGSGAGSGAGAGSGEGQGSGLGRGFGAGSGGDVYRVGNGVTVPQLVRKISPNYTIAAMRAKTVGAVLLECVVLTDGTVGDVRVVRSLDTAFGLDEEAIKAARQWRFRPGTRFGEPVPVLITIELAFSLR